jgi:hypothetical protein
MLTRKGIQINTVFYFSYFLRFSLKIFIISVHLHYSLSSYGCLFVDLHRRDTKCFGISWGSFKENSPPTLLFFFSPHTSKLPYSNEVKYRGIFSYPHTFPSTNCECTHSMGYPYIVLTETTNEPTMWILLAKWLSSLAFACESVIESFFFMCGYSITFMVQLIKLRKK